MLEIKLSYLIRCQFQKIKWVGNIRQLRKNVIIIILGSPALNNRMYIERTFIQNGF